MRSSPANSIRASKLCRLLILFLSPEAAAAFFLESLHYEQLFYCYATASLLLRAYLTYGARGTNLGQAAPS